MRPPCRRVTGKAPAARPANAPRPSNAPSPVSAEYLAASPLAARGRGRHAGTAPARPALTVMATLAQSAHAGPGSECACAVTQAGPGGGATPAQSAQTRPISGASAPRAACPAGPRGEEGVRALRLRAPAPPPAPPRPRGALGGVQRPAAAAAAREGPGVDKAEADEWGAYASAAVGSPRILFLNKCSASGLVRQTSEEGRSQAPRPWEQWDGPGKQRLQEDDAEGAPCHRVISVPASETSRSTPRERTSAPRCI